ncbi:hypothetical protein B0H14DRAFT_2671388, partial [Mycena olivaceomarginata]
MHLTQIFAFVLAVVGSASAICADGQIGIGAEQLSSIGSPGTGTAPGPIFWFHMGQQLRHDCIQQQRRPLRRRLQQWCLRAMQRRKSRQREDWRRDFVDLRRWWRAELRIGAVWYHLGVDMLQPQL